MRTDIILSGVGGQGILSIATIIGAAAIDEGLYIKQAEVHGMEGMCNPICASVPHRSVPT